MLVFEYCAAGSGFPALPARNTCFFSPSSGNAGFYQNPHRNGPKYISGTVTTWYYGR